MKKIVDMWIEEKTSKMTDEEKKAWVLEYGDREDFEQAYGSEIMERSMLDLQNADGNDLITKIHLTMGDLYFSLGGRPIGRRK
jgi:hypothetical protein